MKYFGTHRQTIKNKAKINFYKAKQNGKYSQNSIKKNVMKKKSFTTGLLIITCIIVKLPRFQMELITLLHQ